MAKGCAPFKFMTRLNLSELTGLRASTLQQLVEIMKTIPGASIYHHTHRFLQQHQYLSPEPPNDFAYWITNVIGEKELGEELASVDTIQFSTIADLRHELVDTIEGYLARKPNAALRFANQDEAFYFIKSISFVMPTNDEARSLEEFAAILKNITIDSIYFHIFEARLRCGHELNDFSTWLADCLGEKDLAKKIAALDPYTYTLAELRSMMIRLVEKRIGA